MLRRSHLFIRLTVTVCLAITIFIPRATAQSSNQIFEHITTAHGLSSNKVDHILQDREGFYWITTQNGLNRFDGTSFRIFRNDPADSTTLSHNSCGALLEDLNGDIWIGTYSGLNRYRKSTGRFEQIYLKHPHQISDITNRINSLVLDADGNIWIAGYGLWRYDVRTDSLKLFLHEPENAASIYEDSYIGKLVFDPSTNGIWFTTSSQIHFYSIQQNQFYHIAHNPLNWKIFEHANDGELVLDHSNKLWFLGRDNFELLSFEITQNKITNTGKFLHYGLKRICVDDHNRLWIFYWLASSEIFDPVTGKTDHVFFRVGHHKSILSDKAVNLFIDRENHYWIPSGNGISIYTPANQFYKLFQINIDARGYENDLFTLRAIAQTDSGSLWLGTNVGLYEYDLRTQQYEKMETDPPLQRISTLYSYKKELWIAHQQSVYLFDTDSKKIVQEYKLEGNLFYLKRSSTNDVWAGVWRGGIYRIDLPTKKISLFVADTSNVQSLRTNSTISAMTENDKLWIGYNLSKGFSRYDIRHNRFQHFSPSTYFPSHPSAGIITTIEKDSLGVYWLGTHGSGIYGWTGNNHYKSYRQIDGLKSNFINSIVGDQAGNIWISTSDGLNYFNSGKRIIQSPDISFVLPSSDHIANGIKGVDGFIYFFRPNEIIQINSSLYNPDVRFPKMVISNVRVLDEDFNLHHLSSLELPYDKNFFSFEFSATSPFPDKEISYAYKLDGYDKDWHYTTNNIASYTKVRGGKYRFMVKATNAEGKWSNVLINIPVIVKPPFWRTWWFVAIVILIVLGILYILHLYRLSHVKKIMSVRTQISQDLHDDIGGSLSSIYIYSSVAEKEVMDNPVKAKEFLKQINSSSLQVMDNISDIVWANNNESLHESTLEGRIKNYGYELLSQKNIACTYSIDPQVDSKLSSAEARRNILLIIKEGLNNMAKYSNATQARISINCSRSDMNITIEDNGNGFDVESRKNGNGISTMRQRTQMLKGLFVIESNNNMGTKINCKIPLAKISD